MIPRYGSPHTLLAVAVPTVCSDAVRYTARSWTCVGYAVATAYHLICRSTLAFTAFRSHVTSRVCVRLHTLRLPRLRPFTSRALYVSLILRYAILRSLRTVLVPVHHYVLTPTHYRLRSRSFTRLHLRFTFVYTATAFLGCLRCRLDLPLCSRADSTFTYRYTLPTRYLHSATHVCRLHSYHVPGSCRPVSTHPVRWVYVTDYVRSVVHCDRLLFVTFTVVVVPFFMLRCYITTDSVAITVLRCSFTLVIRVTVFRCHSFHTLVFVLFGIRYVTLLFTVPLFVVVHVFGTF